MPHKDPVVRRRHHREYMRRRYNEDEAIRTKHIALVRGTNRRYAVKAAELVKAFRQDGCALCPERSSCCLTAHHVNPEDKAFDIGNTKNGRYAPDQVAAELRKCVCLCMNCHAKVHAGVRKLPRRLLTRVQLSA